MSDNKSPVDKLIDAIRNLPNLPLETDEDREGFDSVINNIRVIEADSGFEAAIILANRALVETTWDEVIELIESVRDTLEPKPLRFKAINHTKDLYQLIDLDGDEMMLGGGPYLNCYTEDHCKRKAKLLGHPCVFVGEE